MARGMNPGEPFGADSLSLVLLPDRDKDVRTLASRRGGSKEYDAAHSR